MILPTDSDSTPEQSSALRALGEVGRRAAIDNPLIRAISGLIEAHHSVNAHHASRQIIDAAEQNLATELVNWTRR